MMCESIQGHVRVCEAMQGHEVAFWTCESMQGLSSVKMCEGMLGHLQACEGM